MPNNGRGEYTVVPTRVGVNRYEAYVDEMMRVLSPHAWG